MWFIGVEVEQETNTPPPKKNPESAPVISNFMKSSAVYEVSLCTFVLRFETLI